MRRDNALFQPSIQTGHVINGFQKNIRRNVYRRNVR